MKRWRKEFAYLFLVLLFLFITVAPFFSLFIVSGTPEYEMFRKTKSFLPSEWLPSNYEALLQGDTKQNRLLFGGLKNTWVAAVVTLTIGLPVSALTAYILARFRFAWRTVIRNALMLTMAIPVFATIIPLYRMFAGYGLLDNTIAVSMVYVTSFLPVTTWLLLNYFETLPRELEDAAQIDGCGRVSTFFKVILPLTYPALLSAALIIFLNTWGQFQIPLILASSMDTKPIAIVVSEFLSKDTIEYGMTAAAGLIAMIPPIIIAFLFRKYLVGGMVKGATKG